MLGLHTAVPGTILSSGTKRIRWYSGLPQLASVALDPVKAEILMNWRRSILVMARQAVVGRPLLLVAIDAKTHRVIDGALGNGHLHDITMTGGAPHLRPDMRRMIEPDVRFPDEPVNPLPRNVFSALGVITQRLDSRIGSVANVLMTTHADIDARNSRPSALAHPRVTGVAVDANIVGMDVMREIDRLLRPRLDIQKIPSRIS